MIGRCTLVYVHLWAHPFVLGRTRSHRQWSLVLCLVASPVQTLIELTAKHSVSEDCEALLKVWFNLSPM